jgi:hypothetical protein
MRRPLVLFFLAVSCLSAQGLPPEVLTLKRIRDRVQQAVDRLPDVTCVETVDRFWKPSGKEIKPMDRVVLQILFSGGKELFAAPGETHWENNPSAFLASGLMGNGIFAMDLQVVFLNNVSVIKHKGDESLAGRREAHYDFSVSRNQSGYTLHHLGVSGVAAIRGSFWADPGTYDVRRMAFHAEEIPPELLYTDVSTNVIYDRVHIGESDVLLPRSADLRTVEVDGEEKRNVIEFTHCQGFHTESTLNFGGDVAAPTAPLAAVTVSAHPPAEGTLPPGLRVAVALSAPLDDQATVGSLIEGKVVGALMQKGKILVPDGALVKGRIRRLEHYSDASDLLIGDYFIVAVEFMQIETPSAKLRFYAELQDADPAPGVRMSLSGSSSQSYEFWASENRISPVPMQSQHVIGITRDHEEVTTHEVPGVGTFFVRGAHFSLPTGFKTVWKTQLYPGSAHP